MRLTIAVPVYDGAKAGISGLVAVEGTMATIFSEVINSVPGTKSYMYLVDVTHGKIFFPYDFQLKVIDMS